LKKNQKRPSGSRGEEGGKVASEGRRGNSGRRWGFSVFWGKFLRGPESKKLKKQEKKENKHYKLKP